MTVNQKVNLEGCLIKRLLPFIKKHHSNDWYVFWPDMTSSHYANSVQTCFQNNKILYIPKTMNVANVPEIHTIEDFWGFLKWNVYKDARQAKKSVSEILMSWLYKSLLKTQSKELIMSVGLVSDKFLNRVSLTFYIIKCFSIIYFFQK